MPKDSHPSAVTHPTPPVKRIGIDTGGTFTDAVLWDEYTGLEASAKASSTKKDPSAGAMTSIRKIEHWLRDKRTVRHLVHGTTVATNAALEASGPRIAMLCSRGFRDVLEIGRLVRPPEMLYDLHARLSIELVRRRDRFEISERLDHRGQVIADLDERDVVEAARTIEARGIKSAAVCFLYSHLDGSHERAAREILQREVPDLRVSISCEVLPEFREYERAAITALNAYLAPVATDYLGQLEAQVNSWRPDSRLWIMQSNGGVTSAARASETPVTLLLSGPAGGAVAGRYVAQQAGLPNVITVDMGGTSFDVCLVSDGELPMTQERKVMDLPVRIPSVDILTIGAGGGSLGWIDKGGQFRVGPQSAGAEPGPAAYHRGGSAATVTDANVVLGILGDRQLLAGEVELDAAAAHRACEDLGRRLGMSAVEAAWGIRRIANSAMAGAVRAVSVGRGHDPRDFAIIAFGGAGPMHAADIAREIGVTRLVVPAVPGCHSALGMVVTDVAHDYSVSTLAVAESGLEERLNSAFTALERLATSDLRQDGIADHRQLLLRTLDMRYYGQHSHLNVTINTAHPSWLDLALARFHKDHERLYGFMVPDETVEIVNARLRALGQLADHHGRTEPPSAPVDVQAPEPIERRRIYFGPSANESLLTALYDRRAVTPGTHLEGPAIIQQEDSTLVLPPGASALADAWGNLLVSVG